MKKSRFTAILVIVITFLLGGIAGYSVSGLWVDTVKKEPRERYENVSEYLKERLSLDEQQQEVFDEIVKRRQEKMSLVRREFREKFHTQTDSLRIEIQAILRPDQAEEYDVFLEEYRQYREKRERRRN